MRTRAPAASVLRYGYVTNGLRDHGIDGALELVAEHGYAGVALTLDHGYCDPFAADAAREVARVRNLLSELGLSVVVETGARFLLDPRRKHEPTLLSDDGRARRIDFLLRAVDIAAELGAPVVSLWSGVRPADVAPDEAWQRLLNGLAPVLDAAADRGMRIGFEPEPGMLVDTVAAWERLAAKADHPALGITLDIGHCECVEPRPPAECVRRVADRLVHVHIEDMRRGVHEHLGFGEGEIDFPPVLGELAAIGYDGLVAVELSRHSHTAHTAVPAAIRFLTAVGPAANRQMGPPELSRLTQQLCTRLDHDTHAWVIERCAAVVRDPAAIRTIFPTVGRSVPAGPLDAGTDPADVFAWTIQDAVRVRLLHACGAAAPREAGELYRFGDALERRGVLRALDVLPIGPVGIPLVEDALRSNDTRLIAAALGPFGSRVFDERAFRQAVLKCVFVGLPLAGVSDLDTRADAELARMLAAYAHERVAAGRSVPADIWPLVDRYPPAAELAAIEAEQRSVHADRRAAAVAALTARRAFA